MPIKVSNPSRYEEIPDEEDVTPARARGDYDPNTRCHCYGYNLLVKRITLLILLVLVTTYFYQRKPHELLPIRSSSSKIKWPPSTPDKSGDRSSNNGNTNGDIKDNVVGVRSSYMTVYTTSMYHEDATSSTFSSDGGVKGGIGDRHNDTLQKSLYKTGPILMKPAKAPSSHLHINPMSSNPGSNLKSENSPDQNENKQASSSLPTGSMTINPSQAYQSIIGFGGAFTEAAALNFYKLSPNKRREILDLYFGNEYSTPNPDNDNINSNSNKRGGGGIGLNMGRIHINSCDFSESSYSFDEVANDFSLSHFDHTVAHDQEKIIPFIREAMSAAGYDIYLVASPWSPPAWMKVNGEMVGSASPNGLKSDPKTQLAWATYISNFISAYKSNGVPIWAVTPQNEPEFAAPWEACVYNASFESQFIQRYLGPTLKSHHPDLKLLAFDHNKDSLFDWALQILGDDYRSSVDGRAHYVDGMAFHWYNGNDDRLLDGTYGYSAIRKVYNVFNRGEGGSPILLATEGCSCPGIGSESNEWLRAERVSHDIMFDLANFGQGWIDWNLLVDSKGGPNHLDNFCDASIVLSEDLSDFKIQPMFYHLGHFSKFFARGSKRIESTIVGRFNFIKTDPRVRYGLELSLFPCEQSSRQMFTIMDVDARNTNTNAGEKIKIIELSVPTVLDENYDIKDESIRGNLPLHRLCLGRDVTTSTGKLASRRVLKLSPCPPVSSDISENAVGEQNNLEDHPLPASAGADKFEVLVVRITSEGRLVETSSGNCVTAVYDNVDLSEHMGALLELTPCIGVAGYQPGAPSQTFSIDASTGEIRSHMGTCVTSGWPFLNAVAVINSKESDSGGVAGDVSRIAVISNEAEVRTTVLISDAVYAVEADIDLPARSIQTIIISH